MKVRPEHTAHRGFTLIEMLVVISLISLLVALLLPSLSSAQQTSQATRSMSNIKQISFATHMYAEDHKGWLPYAYDDRSPTRREIWPAKLTGIESGNGTLWGAQYLVDLSVFWSPARKAFGGATATTVSWSYPGYGANHLGAMGRWQGATQEEVVNLAKAYGRRYNTGSLSTLLHYAEAFRTSDFPNLGDGRHVLDGTTASATTSLFTYNNNVVRSYVDGHARWGDPMELYWRTTGPRSGSWTVTRTNLRPYAWP